MKTPMSLELLDSDERDQLTRMISCVEREVMMRERVYPGRVYAGRMSETAATYETETMRAVLRRLQRDLAAL